MKPIDVINAIGQWIAQTLQAITPGLAVLGSVLSLVNLWRSVAKERRERATLKLRIEPRATKQGGKAVMFQFNFVLTNVGEKTLTVRAIGYRDKNNPRQHVPISMLGGFPLTIEGTEEKTVSVRIVPQLPPKGRLIALWAEDTLDGHVEIVGRELRELCARAPWPTPPDK